VHVMSMCFHILGIFTSPHAPSNIVLIALKDVTQFLAVCSTVNIQS